jgi:tetratricopeptide (TPR) repeat protein
MKKIQLIIAFLLCFTTISGQTAASADALFQDGDYAGAQDQYARLIKSYPNNALYLYRYARCAQELGDYPTAKQYFERSGNRYDLKHFHLGEVCLQLWYADEAITAYEAYLARPNIDPARASYVEQQIRYAEKLQRYMRRVEKLQVIDSIDVPLHQMIEACALSAEAGRLTYDSIGQIVYTNQREDRMLWGTQDSLQYIVSSHRLLDHWTEPDTLPMAVNRFASQNNPYLLSDGITMYYSACDSNGLGGYDIYVTRYNTATETYTTPENLGLPYNSPANEYLLLIDEGRQRGYLATDRFSAKDSVRIYTFIPTAYKQYWRNVSIDSLAAYAQLRSYILTDNQAAPTVDSAIVVAQLQPADDESIFFVINDSVVYTTLQDFRSEEARKRYQEWEQLHQTYQQEHEQLHQLRYQYGMAEEAERKKITPIILRLENNQSQFMGQCDQLIYTIRQLELHQLQQ